MPPRRLRGKQPVLLAVGAAASDAGTPSPGTLISADVAVPRSAKTPVKCISDTFEWPASNVCSLQASHQQQSCSDVCETLVANMGETESITTMFSGICAETISHNIKCAYYSHTLGRDIAPPVHLSSVELDAECRCEEAVLPSGPKCRFGNILDFASAQLRDEFRAESEPYNFDHMMSLVMGAGKLTMQAHCYACERVHAMARSSGLVAGPPCTDHTSWGQCRRLAGPTTLALAVFLGILVRMLPDWALIENVPSWPEDILTRYAPMYSMSFSVLSNLTFGQCVRRTRKYILLTLKRVVRLTRSLDDLNSTFERQRCETFTWHSYFENLDPTELRNEVLWARGRVGVEPRPLSRSGITRTDFTNSMLPEERKRLKTFLCKFKDGKRVVLSLAQDPEFCKATSTESLLHCLVRNVHLQYSHAHGLWMPARTLLRTQGIPTTNDDLLTCSPTHAMPMSSFNCSRVQSGLPPRGRQHIAHAAGNTMNVAVVGSVLQWLHFYRERVAEPLPISLCTGNVCDRLALWRDASADIEDAMAPSAESAKRRRLLAPTPSHSCASPIISESSESSVATHHTSVAAHSSVSGSGSRGGDDTDVVARLNAFRAAMADAY